MTKAGFGEQLKREREMRGVSLDEICAATRIGTRFLEALENEQWELLPGGVFNRGFVRSIGRYLGLDEENLLAEYTLAMGEHTGAPAWTPQQPSHPPPTHWPANPPTNWPAWAGLLLAVLVLAGGGWFWWRRHEAHRAGNLAAHAHQAAVDDSAQTATTPPADADGTTNDLVAPVAAARPPTSPGTPNPADSSPTATANSAPPPPAATAPATAPPVSPPVTPSVAAPAPVAPGAAVEGLQLKIAAEKNTRLTISADGKRVFRGPVAGGQEYTYSARQRLNVWAQDAGAVALELNGQPLAPIGKSGRPGKAALTRKNLKPAPGETINSELYEEVLSGRTTRERKLAVCTGSAALVPAERAELLTVLAEDGDEKIRERAANSLLSQPVENFVKALQGDAPSPRLFRYCGQNLISNPEIAAAMAKHWRCPPEYLTAAAKRLPSSAVQELMADLDRLSAAPALVAALVHSASLLPDQRVQLEELSRETPEGEAAFAEGAAEAEPDVTRRVTLIQRLSKMRVMERVQMALKGNREERIALIRDPCKVVQRAVLQSARITEREVETFAAMASLTDDVLRLIAMNRNFRRNYTVVRNLINNPKTPIDVSLHLLSGIMPMDLRALTGNKNIPDTLRNAANRLWRQRTEKRD